MKKQISTILIGLLCVVGYSQNNEFIYPDFIGQHLESVEKNPEWKILIIMNTIRVSKKKEPKYFPSIRIFR